MRYYNIIMVVLYLLLKLFSNYVHSLVLTDDSFLPSYATMTRMEIDTPMD